MIALILTISPEDMNDHVLLEKKIFCRLEEGAFYYGNLVIRISSQRSWAYYLLFWHRNVVIERWSFPYKNDLNDCEDYLINVFKIIELLLEKYPKDFECSIDLEFTKIK